MSANIWFWVIYVLIGVVGIIFQNPWRPASSNYPWGPFGSWLIMFILIGILGWGVFGPPIR
jgi:hypothetical protein